MRDRGWFVIRCLLVAVVVAACGAVPPNTLVDGWSVGEPKSCTAGEERCIALLPEAARGLDRRDPGHAPVVSASLHEEGGYPGPNGERVIPVRSGGCCDVALFRLADGSLRAIGVGYPGVSDVPIAILEPPIFSD